MTVFLAVSVAVVDGISWIFPILPIEYFLFPPIDTLMFGRLSNLEHQ